MKQKPRGLPWPRPQRNTVTIIAAAGSGWHSVINCTGSAQSQRSHPGRTRAILADFRAWAGPPRRRRPLPPDWELWPMLG